MYIYSSLPVVFTLPLAFYLHSNTPTHTTYTDQYIQGKDIQVTKGLPDNSFSTILKNVFGEECGRFSLIKLDGIPESFKDMVSRDDINSNVLFCELIWHVVFILLSIIIFKYSIFGMFCRIAMRKMIRASIRFLECLEEVFSKDNILQRVESTSTNCDDEAFFECSSLMQEIVVREESIPKANEAEEKFMELCGKYSSITKPSLGTKESVETIIMYDNTNNDSGMIDVQPEKSMTSQEELVTLDEVGDETSTFAHSTFMGGGEACPEKFKRYLLERNANVERLGISFDSEDGYLPESDLDDESQTALSQISVWEKISHLL